MIHSELGQVITFYSYKGGTGRTMALANTACILAKQSNKRVLMIDWDLEAPGLHHYFMNYLAGIKGDAARQVLESKPGLLDLFYKLDANTRQEDFYTNGTLEELFKKIDINQYVLKTELATLDLMKAGCFDKEYASRVSGFKWEELYNRVPGLFGELANFLASLYDYILVDSRTGVTDISGICSMLMPEKLVTVFTPNSQSINGIIDIVRLSTNYRKNSNDLRPLIVLPLVSRVELNEKERRDMWRFNQDEKTGPLGYQPAFERLFKEVYVLPRCEMKNYFNEIEIQHYPYYAYGEEIAVLEDKSSGRLSCARSYELFAERLSNTNSQWAIFDNEAELVAPPLRQIKILSLTASPESKAGIRYEMEQDVLLDMFAGFDRTEVFIDIPDPVKSSVIEIQENLQQGRHDILFLSAYGGVRQSGEGFLCLEGVRGEEVQVTGAQLLEVLEPKPRIVILSACFSTLSHPNLMPVAETLFKGGIGTVIGMKSEISDLAAIDFIQGLMKALNGNKTIQEAFLAGKMAIATGEKNRCRTIPGWEYVNEDQVPQLLTTQGYVTRWDFSEHWIQAPEPSKRFEFQGAQFLDRGFIGRRKYLREIYRRVEQGVGALLIKGPAGIGKSTLATRAVAQLRLKGYDFIVFQGQTSPLAILNGLMKKAQALGLNYAADICAADIDNSEKLQWFLKNMLIPKPMVVIFDNFEENQSLEANGEFLDVELKEFLWLFRDGLSGLFSLLLFSSRYALPGIETINVGEFSVLEFRKCLLNGKVLNKLNIQVAQQLAQEIGGNPRAVELLDAIAYEEFGADPIQWSQLSLLLPELRERLIVHQDKADRFTPLYLERLFAYLSPEQKQVLDGLSIYRNPVTQGALWAQGVTLTRKDRRKLEDLSLIDFNSEKQTNYVNRLIAKYVLDKMEEAARIKAHLMAAEYFKGIEDDEGKRDVNDGIELRWHYIQAQEWDQAAEITFSLEEYYTLHGYAQISLQLLQEMENNGHNLSVKNLAIVKHQLGILYHGFGDYEAALLHYQKSLALSERLEDILGVSKSLHNIGMVFQTQGAYDAALLHYEKSLALKEKLGDLQGIAMSLPQIGMIYQEKGEYDAALSQYQKALELNEKLGDMQGVSASFHNIGVVYHKKGDYGQALNQYQKSLEINEKLGDIQKISVSLHNVGMIYHERGEYDEALALYKQALALKEKLGDIQGVSTINYNIGMVYQDIGSYDQALAQYQHSQEIAEKIGDIAGVAFCMAQMGEMYIKKEQYNTALYSYLESMLIFSKIGSPNTDIVKKDIEVIRGKISTEQFDAILSDFLGKKSNGDKMSLSILK